MGFFHNLDTVNPWEIIKSAWAVTQFNTIYRQQTSLPYQFNEKEIKLSKIKTKNPWAAPHLKIINFKNWKLKKGK